MFNSSDCKTRVHLTDILLYLLILNVGIPTIASAENAILNDSGSSEEELFDRYASALTLYYDGEFEQSLKYLEYLEGEVNDQELAVWRARSQWMLGDFQAAIQTYTSLINNYPETLDLRLEIAQLIVNSKEPEKVRKYLEEIDDDLISPFLEPHYYKMLQNEKIGLKVRKFHVYFEQGLEWDSNATLGPEDEFINTPLKGHYILNENQTKNEDWVSTSYLHTVYRNLDYSTGVPTWETSASVYYANYFDFSDEDNVLVRFKTGPIHQTNLLSLALPVEYTFRSFDDGDHAYQSFGIATKLKYILSDQSIVRGILQYRKKLYVKDSDEDFDTDEIRLVLGPEYVVIPKKMTLTTYVQGFTAKKEKDLYSYYGGEVSLGLTYRFSKLLRGKVLYRYRLRQYQDNQPGWIKERNDQLHAVYSRISYEFSDVISLHANIGYEHNESNTDLFDYEQVTCGISIGFRY